MKEKRWKRLFQKAKLDRRMAAALLFVLAAAGILLVLRMYSMKQVTTLEYGASAVPDSSVLTRLREGAYEMGEAVWLEQMEEGEPVYRRGSSWYVGESRRAFDGSAPVYVNDGTYLWLLTDGASMVTDEWLTEGTASGMYISDGAPFNFDGSATGDSAVYFLKLPSGLYMNTLSLQIEGSAVGGQYLPANNYMDIRETGIRYLARQSGEKLVYSEIPATMDTEVTLDGESMTYEQLLYRLGILTDQEETAPAERAEADETPLPETVPAEDAAGEKEDDGRDSREEEDAPDIREEEPGEEDADAGESGGLSAQGSQQAASDGQPPAAGTGAPSGGQTSGGSGASAGGSSGSSQGEGSAAADDAGDSADSGENAPQERPGEPGEDTEAGDTGEELPEGGGTEEDGADTDPDADEEESDPGDSEDGEEGEGEGESSGSHTDGDGGSAGESGGGSGSTGMGAGNPPVWVKPRAHVAYEEEDVSVYALEAALQVTDTYGCFDRAVVTMSWDREHPNAVPDGSTPVQLRRTLREAGDFYVDNLPPETKIYVAAYLYYFEEDGTKIQETEPFQTFVIETGRFEDVAPISVQFSDAIEDSAEKFYYENQIALYSFEISGSNGNAVDKVYSARLYVYKKGSDTPVYEDGFSLSSGVLANYKWTGGQDYKTLSSQYVLPANTEYRYRLEFFDRYGNSFNGQEKVFWGAARQENPEDYVRADGYAGEGDLYDPKTDDPWHDPHDKVGEESRYWGYTHTCKSVPEARMETVANADRLTTLSQIKVRMDVEDPHAALTPGAQSVPEGWLGDPPEKDGQQYRVYFMLYASSTGYEPGNERWFVYDEDEDERSLTIGEETPDGYKAYDSSTAGAGQHAFALSGSLPGGSGDDTWVFRGLTAGETYMIRVFATYDLNDYNPQLTQDVEIGSMRFSTTPMASYGRVYYQFTSSHVHTEQPEGVVSYDHEKYESSTAQQIDMKINTGRTLPNLVRDFFSRVDLELKYKSGSKETLATFTLARETLEKKEVRIDASDLSEDGSYRYLLKPGTDYERTAQSGFDEGQMPDLYLDIPVEDMFAPPQQDSFGSGTAYYMVNLWEAFVGVSTEAGQAEYARSMPVLQFCFGEDSLTSYTAYTLTSASTAEQGGWEHIVTANTSSARQSSFTTLKDMPYITMDDMLQVGRYLYLVGLDFHDTDQSIFEGKITVSNTDQSTGSVTELPFELDYSASKGGYIARVELSALREGRAYQLSIAPDDIRRTGRTTAPRYEDEALYTYAYTAGDGVSGQIRMQGLSYPLEKLSGTNVHVLNEYNMYEVGNFEYGAPQIIDGQLSYTTDSNWQTAEPIQVSPGQIYYLNKLRASGNVHLVFLDSSRQPVGAVRTISNSCYLRIPEGVSYMQFSMYYTMTLDDGRTSVYAATQAQALKIYDESDEALSGMNLVETVTPEDGKYPAVQGDLLAVVNGEWVSANKENKSVKITFTEYNESGSSLVISTVTWHPGSYYEVQDPSAASVGIDFAQDELYDVSGNACGWDVRKIDRANADVFTDLDLDSLVTTYTALVNDKAGSLHGSAEDNVIVRVWKTDSGTGVTEELGEGYSFTDRIEEYDQGTADGLGQYTNGRYSESRSFISNTGCVYRIQLSILWRGEEYILDTQEIESDGNVYTIATGKQLLKTVTWPTGSFIVLDDLEVDEKTRSMLNQIFSGTLDGKGYSLSCTYAGSNSGFVFDRLSGSGVIENLEIKWSLNGRERGGRQIYTGFIGRNEGTVRNVVLRYNLGPGNYAHTNSGGLCRFNIGVIENFAVYFESDSTGSVSNAWGSYMGGVCYYNNGTIRNGVVYSARPLLVTTGVYGGTTDISLTSTGGVAGVNTSGGLIENVFAILEMRVERNGASQTAGSTMYHGLLAGNNAGMIRNCFTSGELYYQTWEEDASGAQLRINSSTNTFRSWPGSHQQGRNYEENCYYFSGGVYSKNDIYTQYINLPAALRSQAFYDGSVNRSGAFVVESQIESGYYPIVDMPDCMDGVQDNIALSRAGFGALPTYLASYVTDRSQYMEGAQGQAVYHEGDVLDGAEAEALMASEAGSALGGWSAYLAPQTDGTYRVQQQFALVEFIFTNSSRYNITALNVDNLTAVRLTQTDLEDSTSTVLALLTPGTWENVTAASYSNSYLLRSFGYGYGEGGAGLEAQVENRYVNVKFYYPLSQKSWSVAPLSSSTVVNYRMIEDIRLGAEEMDLAAQTRFISTTLLGEFDGGGHTLDFADVPAQAYFFYEIGAGAVMKDVRVENLKLGATGINETYVGLIRRASDNASLRGIHMEIVSLQNAYQYAGCLAAYVQNVQIKDCTVAGAEITSSASAYELYVGGLVGGSASGSNVSIYNSFVRGLDMRLTQGSSVAGAGGIIGYMYLGSEVRYPVVKSCYAQGEIHTNFSNCGGIAGKCNGSISGCWTDVDIYGSKNMGGIAGYVLASGTQNYNYHSNLVVSGELYTSSGEVESRLMGSWEMAAMRIPQAYAYSGQLLNSEASGDPMDAAALADANTMSEYYFWNDQSALGGAWHLYGTTAEGYGTEIPNVQDYVYPLLYTEDGSELLPDQTAVYYETEKPDFAVASATAEKISEDNNGTYSLRLTLQLGYSGAGVDLEKYFNTYMKEQVSAEGLTLLPEDPVIALKGDPNEEDADVVLRLGSMKQTDEDGEVQTVSCLEAVYQKVKAVNRWDSYRITYDGRTASLSQKIVFQSTNETPEDVYLYWDISEVEDWNRLIVNGEHGSTYENFRIVGDLDFLAGNAGQGLKMNRLEGSKPPEGYELRSKGWATEPEFTVIENVTVSTGTTPWISEITGELKYLEFDSISLKTSTSASNLGLVGQLTGKAEYVDLARININPGSGTDTYTNLGCFGYVTGSIANCRAADIKISGSSNSYYYTNAGGVAGSVREISDVYAFGTNDGGYQVVMGNDTNIARNYFGGIAGYITGTGRGLYGENLSVTGRTYTGGLAGYLNGGVDDTVKTDEAEYQAVNVTVRGYSGAGGAFGYVRQAANARVIGGKVTSVTANAGGVIGNTYTTVRYCEAYDTSVTATEDSAGGIVGYSSWGNIYYSKAGGVQVKAVNHAGGILGSGYGLLQGCAVSEESNIEASESYAGGIAGRMYQSVNGGSTTHLRYNAVSETAVNARSYAGGIAGAVNCADVCYNETDDTVTVKASLGRSGGIGGILSGGTVHHNIAGAAVESANYAGGIAGEAVGYGRSTASGGMVPEDYNVMRMYGNVAANQSVKGTNYVAGLIGQFNSGDPVIDPETGEDISEEAGWTEYMTNTNFYGNTIAAKVIESTNQASKTLNWYANYDTEGAGYTSGSMAQTPRYDCLAEHLDQETKLKLPERISGTGGKEDDLTVVAQTVLKNPEFYTKTAAEGGMEFNSDYISTDGLAEGYYPYVKTPNFTEKNQAARTIQVPYQSQDNEPYNCTWSAGDDGTAESDSFDGEGIPIAEGSTISLFDLNAAENIAYASGIDTLNLDFTHIDSEMAGFKILDAYGRTLLPDTTVLSAAGGGKVCTVGYDYQTDIVVVLYSADYTEQKTYAYKAEQLRNSVMAWDGGYYYLAGDGVRRAAGDGETELAVEGSFVHLYDGKALAQDGTVVELP